ncbi:hypothetical protein D1007_36769 [Hordeum vulgare]|nr:hypothetical protein D1007_36769 [Hordeum vulgare]
MHQATLAEHKRLERLQLSLDAQDQPGSSRNRRELFPNNHPCHIEVMQTVVLNLAIATRIADSIQLSQSAAREGIRQIQALLKTPMQQNSMVSQSWLSIADPSSQIQCTQLIARMHSEDVKDLLLL